jgi:diphosphomevalonate decarboxylase
MSERDSKRQNTGVPPGVKVATARCSSNIAVIKYWGKRDEKLLLPINSSLSVTMDPNQMGTTTTAAISPSWTDDRIWLNGKEENAKAERIQNCIRAIRAMAGKDAPEGGLRIVSENNFPTAAGLASSASGYACLVLALGKLFGITEDLSSVARQGSGSACRSVYGGFVKWDMGKADDGSDSRAYQVAKADHWPELHALILVVSDEKKKVSSTGGMEISVKTSTLLAHRAKAVVPERMDKMEKAILDKDFETFAQLTMADSNSFHATVGPLVTLACPCVCWAYDTPRT